MDTVPAGLHRRPTAASAGYPPPSLGHPSFHSSAAITPPSHFYQLHNNQAQSHSDVRQPFDGMERRFGGTRQSVSGARASQSMINYPRYGHDSEGHDFGSSQRNPSRGRPVDEQSRARHELTGTGRLQSLAAEYFETQSQAAYFEAADQEMSLFEPQIVPGYDQQHQSSHQHPPSYGFRAALPSSQATSKLSAGAQILTSPLLPPTTASPQFPSHGPMASPPITPTNLLYPDLMPAFPYIASASVAAEARARDVAGTDEGGGSDGGKKNRLAGKRNNEKMRREAIKSQVTQLTATIPGMASYSHTRKAVMLCTLEYIQQLQTREKRLRVQLISRYLRERGLISSLLRRGTGLEEIAGLCAEATTGQLDEVVAEIESSIA